MSTYLDTFRVPQTQYPLQFVPYNRPPKPKQPSQHNTTKVLFSKDTATRSTAEWKHRKDLVSQSDEVELVDLITEETSDCEISSSRSGGSGNVSSDDRFFPSTKREDVQPTSQDDAADEVSRQPATSGGSSQRDIVVIEDSESDPEAEEDDSHKDEVGLQIGDQAKTPGLPAPKALGREFPAKTSDIFNPETQLCQLARLEPLSTPPTSPSMIDTERSMKNSARSIHTEANTHHTQQLQQGKAHREVRLSTIENTNSSNSSGGDTSDGDRRDSHATSLTLKRKRLPPANGASVHPSGSDHETEMLYSEDNSSDDNSSNESSREKKGGGNYNRKRPKRFRSRKGSTGCSRPITQNPSSTRARPQPNRKVGPSSTNGPSHGRVQWHPSLIAFHPLSADVSFFTALFRARGGREILSTSHAFKLMENVIGHTMKLDDVAIKPLPPDAWFLTALVRKCSKLNRANATSSRAARRASAAADDDDGSSSDDCSDGVDEGDESSGGLADKTSKPWKRAPPWLKDDEDNLRQWKKDDKSWHWICSQFPNRSPGAVKLRWYQKLRKRA